MMAFVAAALVVCAVAVGALGYAVLALSRQVHGLAERLVDHSLAAAPASGSSTQRAPRPSAQRAAGAFAERAAVSVEGADRSSAEHAAARSTSEPARAMNGTAPEAGASPAEQVEPAEVERVDVTVITNLDDAADDVDLTTSRVASVTLAGPLIKVAAFSHGVRQALDEESRMRIGYAVRKELKRQRKLRRRQRSREPTSMGDRP